MKKKILSCLFGATIFISCLFPVHCAAASFSVQSNIPANQRNKNATYFDLRMHPEQQQTIEVTVNNASDKEIIVENNLHSAVTNSNGVVEYNNTTIKKDASLPVKMENIAEVAAETTVPAKSKINVPIKITMPKKPYDGVLLGGISFFEKNQETKSPEKKAGARVESTVGYTIGIQLSETDAAVKPNINLLDVKPGQKNYRNAIIADLQNDKSVIISNLAVNGSVYKKGSDKALYNAKLSATMAPNSTMGFPISTNNEALKAGKYVFKGEAVSGDNRWHFEKSFAIKGIQAKKINAESVEVKRDNTPYYIIAIVVLVLVLGSVIVYLVIKLKKQK